jgi:hypothetical protein
MTYMLPGNLIAVRKFGKLVCISRQLSRYYHDTCEKCSFVALLDMDGVSHFMFWSGALVCLILQIIGG